MATGDGYLFVLNDAPYVTERSYQALRIAVELAKRDPAPRVRVFLLGDGVRCAARGQERPPGAYNVEIMLRSLTKRGVEVGVCGTCMDARRMTEADLTEATRRATMADLADWTLAAAKPLVF